MSRLAGSTSDGVIFFGGFLAVLDAEAE